MKAKGKNRVVEPHWRQVELPIVAETFCTGWGWCVEVCRTECLALRPRLPWMPRPLDCVGCSLCVSICPANES